MSSQSTQNVFGSTRSTPSSGSSIFGTPAGGFGTTSTSSSSSSSSSSTSAFVGSIFGTPGGFGTPPTSSSSSSTSAFGTPAGGFGTTTSSSSSPSASTPIFGTPAGFGAAPTLGFGSISYSPTSGFGRSTNGNSPSPQSSHFSTNPSNRPSLFGGSTTSTSTSTSKLGSSTIGSSSSTTSNTSDQPPTSVLPTATSLFGSTTVLKNPVASTSLFGSIKKAVTFNKVVEAYDKEEEEEEEDDDDEDEKEYDYEEEEEEELEEEEEEEEEEEIEDQETNKKSQDIISNSNTFLNRVASFVKIINDKEYQTKITDSKLSERLFLAQLEEKRSSITSCLEERVEQLEESNLKFAVYVGNYIHQLNKDFANQSIQLKKERDNDIQELNKGIEVLQKDHFERIHRLETQSKEREEKIQHDHQTRLTELIELEKKYENLKGERLEGLDDKELNHLIETNQKSIQKIDSQKYNRLVKTLETLKKEKQDLVDQSLCAVCSEEPTKIILKPCQHFCLFNDKNISSKDITSTMSNLSLESGIKSFEDRANSIKKNIDEKSYQNEVKKAKDLETEHWIKCRHNLQFVQLKLERRIKDLEDSHLALIEFSRAHIEKMKIDFEIQSSLETDKLKKAIEEMKKENMEKIQKLNTEYLESHNRYTDYFIKFNNIQREYKHILGEWLHGLGDQELNSLIETNQKSIQKIYDYKMETLKMKNQELVDQILCAVCSEEPTKIILKPCKHLCLCKLCASKVTSCPMCRSPITKKKQIFS
ncbi:hypothetical protein DFA_07769 [Cavenderia fasciculata]|uniref:RING-type domain-containing protein n=1 Tax=Cavenderia fasciculata TaxID=261658 RepID=F4Q369_CACFS|nr:uncharacterized protein DFA_07769 [Cavenderia fasciculata]EGG16791.1 hypothetical protein DFA_07769 [Cavenderia fasciculata]|eukprot:XP_004355265.1 hypothetical protein DFA_07769 [Cavenderia fasciculata]